MQIKNIIRNKKSIPLIVLKVVFLSASLGYIMAKFIAQGPDVAFAKLPDGFAKTITVCMVLMIINWGLEAYRWKRSITPFEKISFRSSFKVVLGGLAMNLVLPFTIGDALARILTLRNKYQATSAMVLNRAIMLAITLLYGVYSMHVYFHNLSIISWPFWSFIAGLGGMISLLFFKDQVRKLRAYFKGLNIKLITSIVFISLLRYLVFVLQFFILIELFFPSLSSEVIFLGIGWVFLTKSVLPSFLGGIGVREASGLFFFSQVVPNAELVVAPIFIIWVINTMIPSIVGLASVWNFRFKIAGWSFLSRG